MWYIDAELPIQLAIAEINNITVNTDKTAFHNLKECANSYKSKYENYSVGKVEGIQYARRLFQDIGIDPTKHRPASEALLNRALKNKQFYSVNSLVDVGNWCSLDFLLPISVYDMNKIIGDVELRKGKEDESYIGLNNLPINLHNRYVLSDETGPFGSPIKDSQRTAVNYNTSKAILLIYAPKHYDINLLKRYTYLFAQRAIDICKGELNRVCLLPEVIQKENA